MIDPIHPLQSNILDVLAKNPDISVSVLHGILLKKNIAVSVPNLYKVVADLIDNQLINKTKGNLSINLIWLLNLESFLNQAKNSVEKSAAPSLLFPSEDGKTEIKTDSLRGLDALLIQIITKLLKLTNEKVIYSYHSRPWWALSKQPIADFCQAVTANSDIETYMLHGNDSFLDKFGAGLINNKKYHVTITDNPPFPKEGYVIASIDGYTLECKFPEELNKHLSLFFYSIKKIEQFDHKIFFDLFKKKLQFKITVKKNHAEADKIKQMIGRYFK